jgi:hypothetical protein
MFNPANLVKKNCAAISSRSCIPTPFLRKALLVGLLLTFCIFSAYPAQAAETNIIREMAKNKARVIIIVSGPQASVHGKAVQGAILRHPECKHKPEEVSVVSIEEAEREAAPRPKEGPITFIWIIASKEWNGKIPEALTGLLPKRLSELKEGGGISKVEITSPKSRGLAFVVEIVAPDGERLSGLIDTFKSKSALIAEGLPFAASHGTYKLAAFSAPEDKDFAEIWGHAGGATWTDYKWFPLEERDKLSPEQLEEYNQVYFIDRSRKAGAAPGCVAPLLDGQNIKETTTLVRRGDLGHGLSIAVFTAPNQTILQAKAKRFGAFNGITGGQVVEDVKDLRHIGQTTLLISGAGPNAEDKEAIRLLTAKTMRDKLKMTVEERGDLLKLLRGEVTLEELQGATGTADMLRRKGNLRYIWLFHVLEYGGGTEYRTSEKLTQEDQAKPYTEREPQPDDGVKEVGGGRKDAIARRRPIYESEHQKWEQDKRRWDREENANLRAQYDREITVTTGGKVRGILRLVDLKNSKSPVEVIWEQECNGSSFKGPDTFKRDSVTVRAGSRPDSLSPPANTDTCSPALLKQAAVEAASHAILQVQETAWLPDGTEPIAVTPVEPGEPGGPVGNGGAPPASGPGSVPPTVPVVAKPGQPLVASVDGNTVTITREGLADVKVGDRAMIILKTEPIKHPTTGEILREKIVESITLKIVHVDAKTLDGVPVSAAEAAKLPHVQSGAVVKIWRPIPPPGGSKPIVPKRGG